MVVKDTSDRLDIECSLSTTTAIFVFCIYFQGKYDKLGPIYNRSLTIKEKVLGPNHPDVAASLTILADLLKAQVGILDVPSCRSRK